MSGSTSDSVTNAEYERECSVCFAPRSGGEQVRLLGQGKLQTADSLRILLVCHLNHLDPTQEHTGSGHRMEEEHGPDPPLDSPVALLGFVIIEHCFLGHHRRRQHRLETDDHPMVLGKLLICVNNGNWPYPIRNSIYDLGC